ncbi:MAG: type II secretion system GspH family protein [Phycisphaerae bacterium]|nr:type II secretion system GspH family protein [Phycisphaerae bacterium]
MGLRQGFTLIELMTTVAIIVLLIGTVMPVMDGAVDLSEQAICQSNQRQMLIAWLNYNNDNHNRLVRGIPDDAEGWVQEGSGTDPIRNGKLFPYAEDVGLFKCPSDSAINERSYSIVAPLHGERWDLHRTDPGHSWVQQGTDRFVDILNPAQQVVYMEESDPRTFGYPGPWNVGSWIMYVRESYWWNWIDFVPNYHGRRDSANLAFADGHVELWKWQDPDTMQAADDGMFFYYEESNEDWLRIRKVYRQLQRTPDVPWVR